MRFPGVASTTGLSVKLMTHKDPVIVNEDRSPDDSQAVPKWRNGNMQRSVQNSIVALTLMRNCGGFLQDYGMKG